MARLRGMASVGEYIAEKGRQSIAATLYDRLADMGADALISALGGSTSPVGFLLTKYLQSGEAEKREVSKEQRKAWRKERIAWLKENQWRFDWRSQPRRPAGTDDGGEWLPGRLDYQKYQKRPISRKQLQLMKRRQREHNRWVKSNMKIHNANKKRIFIRSSFAGD